MPLRVHVSQSHFGQLLQDCFLLVLGIIRHALASLLHCYHEGCMYPPVSATACSNELPPSHTLHHTSKPKLSTMYDTPCRCSSRTLEYALLHHIRTQRLSASITKRRARLLYSSSDMVTPVLPPLQFIVTSNGSLCAHGWIMTFSS